MEFISRLCDPVIVMAEGQVLAQGTAEAVKSNEQVIEAYLGTGAALSEAARYDGVLDIADYVPVDDFLFA